MEPKPVRIRVEAGRLTNRNHSVQVGMNGPGRCVRAPVGARTRPQRVRLARRVKPVEPADPLDITLDCSREASNSLSLVHRSPRVGDERAIPYTRVAVILRVLIDPRKAGSEHPQRMPIRDKLAGTQCRYVIAEQ